MTNTPSTTDNLRGYLPRFSTAQRVKQMSERTIADREGNVGAFLDWAEARSITRPHDVTLLVLERYAAHLYRRRKRDGQPLDARTQRGHLSSIRAFFKWLVRQKVILHNPAADLELPKVGSRLPRAVLTAVEADTVLAQPDVRDVLGLRDRAILETLYSTGVRRAAICNLTIHDVDFDRGVALIRAAKGNKDRMVAIGDRALAWVLKYLDRARPELVVPPDDRVLFLSNRGRALSPDTVSDVVGHYVTAAGIGKPGACHLFRHTAATLMHDNGADIRDIQSQLGHAELSTTAIYTRVSIRRLKEVHTRTHPAEDEAGLDEDE